MGANLDYGRYPSQCLILNNGCRVDPGGYPPGPPTDPDVRNSRIRLFRRMGSLRDGRPSRTCWSSQLSYPTQFRRDDSEVQSPHHLSLQRFHALAPPSLLRVPSGSVPRSHRYYEALRLPAIHPGGLVDLPAGTVPALFVSLPPSTSTAHGEPGFWSAGFPSGILRTEKTGSPEFPSDPLDACPAHIRPRRDRSARPSRRPRCCLPLMTRRRLPRVANFGAQSHGLHLRCLRFAVTVTRPPRKTRFRAGASLTRAGFDPQDLYRRFPSDSSHVISSPFPELCSAHAIFCIV